MAKYEVEIDDATALRWSHYIIEEGAEIDPECVRNRLEEMVMRYGTFPAIQSNADRAAMALARAKAMEHAAAMGDVGGGNPEYRADMILRFILGQHNP